MNTTFDRRKWMNAALCLVLFLTLGLAPGGLAVAEGEDRFPATPFIDEGSPGERITGAGALPLDIPALAGPDINGAGTWLLSQQLAGGCFPWTKGDATCPSNTQGPTGRGLLEAYELTHTASFLTAAVATGDYLVPNYPRTYPDGDPRFATHDPLFLEELSQVTGDTDYAAFMQTYFWNKLSGGTYGELNDMDAYEFGASVVTARAGQGYVELSPWDLSATAIAAHIAGETGNRDALMQAILYGLESTTLTDDTYDVIGLAGAIWASAVTGVDLNPTAGRYAAYNSTAELAALLASWQRSSDGAWLWSTTADPLDVTNGDTQTTAYVILGLYELDPSTYATHIAGGAGFIRTIQASDGQLLAYPTAPATAAGGVETHAESMAALVTAAPSAPSVWTKTAQPVMTGSMAFDPCVLKEGSTYKMWYTHVDDGGNWRVYYSTSADGIAWAAGVEALAPSGTAGAYDETRVGGPSVINDGGTYKMWFHARDADAIWTVGYATSADGITWTQVGQVLDVGPAGAWDSQLVREPSVMKDGATYKMWYAGTAIWPVFKIGYATSPDGTTWTKHGSNPIFTGNATGWDAFQVYAPSVVLDAGTYHMYFSGTDNNLSAKWSTGHATSADGITWTEDSRAPILIPDGTDDSLDYVSALNDGGIWKIWYSYGGNYAIGLATLTSDTQLWLDPAIGSIPNDNTATQTFTVNIANALDLYGYQLVITFDASNLEATAAAFDDTFFTDPMSSPPTWNATRDNVNGRVYFARTRQNPDPPLSGSGPLATVTFRSRAGAAAGSYKIDFDLEKLGDIDGNELPVTTQYAWLTLFGRGNLEGSVDLQGRSNESGFTVTIMNASGYLQSQTFLVDGTWSFTNIPAGNYQVNIEMARYLDAQKGDGLSAVTVPAGGTTTLSQVRLLGGDADDTDTVDISDAVIIGDDFGNTPPTDVRADINDDGSVDILDLVLMGGNYGKSSPVPWP